MAIDTNKKPSKYIKNNLESNEEFKCVIICSKGLFGDKDDIVVTNKRVFANLENGSSYNFPLDKIPNAEAVPEKGLFGREKKYGVINIY